jgi:tRNA(Ile2)-agmatinylcytidine synthase
VIFRIADGTGEIACAAYEPTKGFRDVVSALIPGDEVEVYGGVRAEPLTINVEKIRIISAPPQRVKISNPVCPHCNRKMESVGAGKGYRCRRCGYRLGEEAAEYRVVERNIEGFYEVPVIARRHLARPLKLIREDNMGNVF